MCYGTLLLNKVNYINDPNHTNSRNITFYGENISKRSSFLQINYGICWRSHIN